MIKKIMLVIILLCLVGCQDTDYVDKMFLETINGHSNRENVISVDDVYSKIYNVMGSSYDKIEYYDTVNILWVEWKMIIMLF